MEFSNSTLFRLLAVGSTTVLVGGIVIAAHAETAPNLSTKVAASTSTRPSISPSPRPSISISIGTESDEATDDSAGVAPVAPNFPNPKPTISLSAGSESDDASDDSVGVTTDDSADVGVNSDAHDGSSASGDLGLVVSDDSEND